MTTALEGGEGSASRPGHSLPAGKDPVPFVQEAGWAPGPVWTGAENLAPTGIRCPNRPAHSHSLYRLSYPDPEPVEGNVLLYKAHLRISKPSAGRKPIANNGTLIFSKKCQIHKPIKAIILLLTLLVLLGLLTYLLHGAESFLRS